MSSSPSRHALARALGAFWYWGAGPSHADIDRVFDTCGLSDRLSPGGKRERVEAAVTVAKPNELPGLLLKLVDLLHERGCLEATDENQQQVALLKRRLAPFQISFDEDGVSSASIGVEPGRLLDTDALRDHVIRLHRAIEHDDSALVLGSAKELLESTAKLVLNDRGAEAPSKFPALLSAALSSIGLHPKEVDGSGEIADATRRVLGGLNQIAVGVNELRNDHGTGHGHAGRAKLSLRHARLAAGAATVLSTLMLDTLEDPNAPWRQGDSSGPPADSSS